MVGEKLSALAELQIFCYFKRFLFERIYNTLTFYVKLCELACYKSFQIKPLKIAKKVATLTV
jgi:hypothetical protein